MARINDRGDKQMLVFDKVADKVKTFYAEKGYSIANYDELVANIAANRVALQTANQNMASNGSSFDCESDDPKGSVVAFKEKEVIRTQAMKEYKTAIQSLIVAVKTAAETKVTTEVTE